MTTTRPRRIALAATLGLAALAVTACGQTAVTPVAKTEPAMDTALHAQLPASVRTSGVLVVGTDPSYAPMSSYATNGRTIVGMEPDLARDLGNVLGVKVKVRDVAFDTIIDQVNAKKIDIGLSAMTDTAERAKAADFVDYFRTGTAIVVQRGNPKAIHSLRDLCGKPVAVEKATVQVDLLDRQQSLCGTSPIKVEQFANNADALLHLRTGRADAVLNDLPPATLIANDAKTRQFYQLASDAQYDPGYYGLVVAKGDQEMRTTMTRAMGRLLADGRYRDLLATWHLQGGAVDQVLVNSGRS